MSLRRWNWRRGKSTACDEDGFKSIDDGDGDQAHIGTPNKVFWLASHQGGEQEIDATLFSIQESTCVTGLCVKSWAAVTVFVEKSRTKATHGRFK